MDTSNITESINENIERLKSYIAQLSDKEKIGWLMIVGGIILVILGLIFW